MEAELRMYVAKPRGEGHQEQVLQALGSKAWKCFQLEQALGSRSHTRRWSRSPPPLDSRMHTFASMKIIPLSETVKPNILPRVSVQSHARLKAFNKTFRFRLKGHVITRQIHVLLYIKPFPIFSYLTMDSPGPNDLPSRAYTLVLVSHSHSPPLVPAPQLKFDLRKITNPPKHIRDAYDGRSKRLREHMLANDDFVALVETAQASIAEEMMSFVDRDNDISGKHSTSKVAFAVTGTIWELWKHL